MEAVIFFPSPSSEIEKDLLFKLDKVGYKIYGKKPEHEENLLLPTKVIIPTPKTNRGLSCTHYSLKSVAQFIIHLGLSTPSWYSSRVCLTCS